MACSTAVVYPRLLHPMYIIVQLQTGYMYFLFRRSHDGSRGFFPFSCAVEKAGFTTVPRARGR